MNVYRIGMDTRWQLRGINTKREVPFAHFSAVGTWIYEREPCKACGWHWQTIFAPLLVQWERSSDVIGDFSWDRMYTFVVKLDLVPVLKDIGFDCGYMVVEYVKPEKKRQTVPFPYSGPELWWCDCTARVELDLEASGVALESYCKTCGDKRYKFINRGIVIRRSDWQGQHMFRIASNGRSDATFVTEVGRRLIEAAGLTNIAFTEAGEIVD